MKRNILFIIVLFFLASGLTTLFFNSCSKDELKNEEILNEDLRSILSFNSDKEYIETLDKVLSMNPQELKAYEESKGYKSFGRLCDEIYYNINPEDFKSIEEVKTFVSKNSEYLRLVEDENGEFSLETILSDNPNRYLINDDKMFIINKNVYKVFEEGIVTTQVERKEFLKGINDKNISKYIDNVNIRYMPIHIESINETRLKDASYNCGTYHSNTHTDNTNRTTIEISISYWDTYDINGIPMTIFQNRVFVKPEKKTIFWFGCTRTISCDVKIAVDYETISGWERDFVYHYHQDTEPTWNYEFIISGGVISFGYWARYNMHYGAYDCWGDTPSTHPANLECNIQLF